MKKFLIADDHSIVRTGISLLLKEEFMNIEIDECKDGDTVWEKIKTSSYDLAILDINMPGTDSINLLQNIFAFRPDLKVLILTMSKEEIYARIYMQLGVKGFINKEADDIEIRKAITTTLNNKKYLSPEMHVSQSLEANKRTPSSLFNRLSPRELEVMTHLLEGKNVSQIANLLCAHTSTIGTHKAKVLQKLGVTNIIELKEFTQMFNHAGYGITKQVS
ncbi:two component transcriptional regulator, LuxR family [Chitinophaga sp. CF118]|uniref:response regulator n=1 Tax=Chitinophaga sp. CF118 TaxID=1884367 RepID=UPI0008E3B8BA|nr:response regulator transcription factor [Chitinophaga sp. CF118]SFE51787.1 two component transcriptional regulator, LuxR family [Chitinophaga sp. CF118]